jgi:hypothetical protein
MKGLMKYDIEKVITHYVIHTFTFSSKSTLVQHSLNFLAMESFRNRNIFVEPLIKLL